MTFDRLALGRFLEAQQPVWETALAELRQGRKRGRWMDYLFPRLAGLAGAEEVEPYALGSIAGARAYRAHSILGPRLQTFTETVTTSQAKSLQDLLGPPDDQAFLACMTLFALAAATRRSAFRSALERWNDGLGDAATLHLLARRRLT